MSLLVIQMISMSHQVLGTAILFFSSLICAIRNAYRCEKKATGELNHRSLIKHIKEESLASPDREDIVSFEAGVKRGKVYVPTYTAEEQEEMKKKAEIAEKVKLDPDEEEALAAASLEDVMALADILNTNPQKIW